MLILRAWRRVATLSLIVLAITLRAEPASAFWLLGFSTADTQPAGTAGFIGGTGGQLTEASSKLSFTPYLAHAGLRLGLWDGVDVGYRLCTVALPYNTGGPTLGGQLDVKLRLTTATAPTGFALGVSGANAFVDFSGQQSVAWSPGAYFILSHGVGARVTASIEGRYVYTWVPGPDNQLHAAGGSAGLKIDLHPGLSIRPEVGFFDFVGTINGQPANGWGLQYGAVLAARVW